jgi:hypothetical protein
MVLSMSVISTWKTYWPLAQDRWTLLLFMCKLVVTGSIVYIVTLNSELDSFLSTIITLRTSPILLDEVRQTLNLAMMSRI